jgi:TonB-linked SusC/RagA family outer membrane protein
MKNSPIHAAYLRRICCSKIFKVMRNTILLLLLSVFQVFAGNSYSQNTTLSLDLKDVQVKDILSAIEDQSEFYFLYNSKLVDVNNKTSLIAKEERIDDILDQLFHDTDVKYMVFDRQIILTRQDLLTQDALASVIGQQQQPITGKVTDQNNHPLAGVTIVVKGTTQGTSTDPDGNYSLRNVPPDAVLLFSFVGMLSLEVPVDNRTRIDIVMEEEVFDIQEVVAIGYGSVQKQDLTGAVAVMGGDVIENRKTVRVSQALQGAIPGVMVTRSSSAADASATIRIRGITTIGDNDPLIIIDGVPGTLDWVNPNDIDSISVLKDAASASIYGSRAAAGVILVTTKEARSGQLTINYNMEYGVETPTRLPEYGDAVTYMQVSNEMQWNDNDNTGSEYPIYAEDLINNYAALHAENPDLYPDVNWTDMIVNKNAPRQKHSLSLSAGTDKIQSLISLAYDKSDALYDGRSYDRYTIRANNNAIIGDYLSMEFNIHGIYSENKHPSIDFGTTFKAAPIYPAEWSDGRLASGKGGENSYGRLQYGGFDNTTSTAAGFKLALNVMPFDGFKISGVVSPQVFSSKNKDFNKAVTYTAWDDPDLVLGYLYNALETTLDEARNENYNITAQLLANYTKDFGGHSINVLAGFENYYYFNESLGASRDQYNLTTFPYLDLGNENYQYNSGSAYEYAYRSFFGRIMYNFRNKYYIQANSRYDGSSRFQSENRWGLFPSFSAGWDISKESFMENVAFLSLLKLRASWGTLGNERIGNYPYQSTIGFGSALFYQGNAIVSSQTAAVTKYAIPDISWETTETYNVGLDAYFLNNKLSFTGDYYKKTTRDMLLALEIPHYIGLANPDQNTGEMYTKGWEVELRYRDNAGALHYSISANLSDFRSIMGDLGGTEFIGDQVKYEGSEFNEWYGYISEGLFQSQGEVDESAILIPQTRSGNVKYRDLSGPDGIPDGIISPDYDRTLLGGSLPRYLYGGNILLEYKNFDLSLVFQGVGKQNSRISNLMVEPLLYSWEEVPQVIVGNYWSEYNTTEENLQARYPRLSDIGRKFHDYACSDYWLFNGAYFRMKNIMLGYKIPPALSEKVKIRNARIYVSISDLFSIDSYIEGWDPEWTSSYWITKSFILGLNVNF